MNHPFEAREAPRARARAIQLARCARTVACRATCCEIAMNLHNVIAADLRFMQWQSAPIERKAVSFAVKPGT